MFTFRIEASAGDTDFPIFKTIKLGTGLKTADDFRAALKAADCRISDGANDILAKPAFKAADEEMEVDLVVRSVGDLGFFGGATYAQICECAKALGLDLCSPEVGPQLRLQYSDQPRGELLVVAMESIADSDSDLKLFDVERDEDDHWLYAFYGSPDRYWSAADRFVFSRRKST